MGSQERATHRAWLPTCYLNCPGLACFSCKYEWSLWNLRCTVIYMRTKQGMCDSCDIYSLIMGLLIDVLGHWHKKEHICLDLNKLILPLYVFQLTELVPTVNSITHTCLPLEGHQEQAATIGCWIGSWCSSLDLRRGSGRKYNATLCAKCIGTCVQRSRDWNIRQTALAREGSQDYITRWVINLVKDSADYRLKCEWEVK